MTSRNISTVITIGGSIASSLPSSTKRAVAELNRLKIAQQQDVGESNRLKVAIRGLARGSDEYKTRVQQLKDAQQRINFRTDEIGKVGARTREASSGVGRFTGRLSALKAGIGPVGLALGAVTGIVLALGGAFSRAGAEANSILLTSARFGVTSETFQRGAVYMRTFTQDAGRARQQFESLLKVGQDFERVRYGEQLDPRRFLAAARLGVNVNDLIQGKIDPTQLFEQVAAGFKNLAPEEARLRAEVLLGPELATMAAAVADGNLSVEEANRRAESARVLSEDQLRENQAAGQNIDEIRQKITELLNQVTNYLIPPIIAIAKFFGFDPEEQKSLPERVGSVPAATPRPVSERLFGGEDNDPATNNPRTREAIIRRREYLRSGATRESIVEQQRGRFTRAGETTLVGQPRPEVARFPRGTGAIPRRDVPTPVFPRDRPSRQRDMRSRVDVLENLTGRQRGGLTKAGELTLVGENGPEVARFPTGTEIIPQSRRDDGAGGFQGGATTITQTFYVTIINPSSDLDIERSLADAAGKVGTNA